MHSYMVTTHDYAPVMAVFSSADRALKYIHDLYQSTKSMRERWPSKGDINYIHKIIKVLPDNEYFDVKENTVLTINYNDWLLQSGA